MALKTDYKDDILDLTQNDNRRFELIENQDDTVSFSDVTVYEQEGDNFTSRDLNATNEVVNTLDECLEVTDDGVTAPIRFGVDANGDYGYKKVGADTITPFKSKHTETYTATSRANNLDMGLYHKKRYVDTTAVPNSNSTTYSAATNGTHDMGATNTNRYVSVNVPPSQACGPVLYVQDCVDRWHTSWLTISDWSKYRGFVVVAWAGNAVGGISYGTLTNGVPAYVWRQNEYAYVEVSGNQIRGGEQIMSNVAPFLLVF